MTPTTEIDAAVRAARRPRTLSAAGVERLAYVVSGVPGAERLPRALVILLENVVRRAETDDDAVRMADAVLRAGLSGTAGDEIEFMPARVLFQDFTGVPVFVDFAAMRDAASPARSSSTTPSSRTRPSARPRSRGTSKSRPTATASASPSSSGRAARSATSRSSRRGEASATS